MNYIRIKIVLNRFILEYNTILNSKRFKYDKSIICREFIIIEKKLRIKMIIIKDYNKNDYI